jgi:hypothetical protein
MIRQTLTGLLLGLLILAEPCLATADTTGNSKKPPQKPPEKVVPQIPESPSPSKSSRLKKYRSPSTYHPHQGKGHLKPGKPNTP